MPPRHCLGQLPLHPVVRPASCLARPQFLAQATPAATFSTSAANFKNPNQKKGNSTAGPPKKGGQGLRIKKAGGGAKETGRRPAPGERKQLRKRIVLSNTNALEVPDLADLTAEDVGDSHIQGKVLGIPMEPVVDQLRAVDAFKPNQAWGLFRRPAMLVRGETLELGRLISAVQAEDGNKVVKKIVHGDRASGKTTLLLQAMTMAFLKGWVVINFPDAMELTNGNTAYAPLQGTNPTQYAQKNYTASLLNQIAKANEKVLAGLKPTEKPSLPVPVKDDITLLGLAQLGVRDPDIAWPVFQALWKELTTRGSSNKDAAALARPPLMVCLDNLSFVLNDSAYIDGDAKPIHAYDFVLARHFLDLLSAEPAQLPNGGVILAATSGSNAPRSPALNFAIASIEAKQSGATEMPKWNPYEKLDDRILSALSKAETLRVKGITREEARAIMEYYAQSGMMRRTVDESLVSEKWTVSGGGIIGELERATVKYRI